LKPPGAARSVGASAAPDIQREAIRRSIVLMIDDLGAWAEQDVLPVVTATRKFANEQIAPGDLVSITSSRGGMGFFQQLTSDPRHDTG
jgi:hypothetical protein